jgi:hypothetical protein
VAVVPFQYRYEHGTAGGAGECVEDQKIPPVGVHHVLPARILIPVVERVLVEQLSWVSDELIAQCIRGRVMTK